MFRTAIFLAAILTALPIAAQGFRGHGRSEDAWRVLAERYDQDGDGRISPQEYGHGQERFLALDRNADGFLTAADFAGAGRATDRKTFQRGVRSGRAPQPGEMAPDFVLGYAKDKTKTVQLSSFAGKHPVALVFGSYT